MSHCFGNNRNLSAKEYVINKGNNQKFCDLRTKFISNSYFPIGNNIACVDKNGSMVKYNNHENLLNLKKAHANFRADLQYFAGYGQQFKKNNCNPIPNSNNTDISNNYNNNDYLLTYSDDNSTAQNNVIDSLGTYNNRYAEINTINPVSAIDLSGNHFKNKKLEIFKRCTIRENTKNVAFSTIITQDDVENISVTSIEMIFI